MEPNGKITLSWLIEKKACKGAVSAFQETFGEEAPMEDLIYGLHHPKSHNEVWAFPPWEAWILGQEKDLTIALVEKGANIHVWHDAALVWAVRCGTGELVKYLVEEVCLDIHTMGESPLLAAVDVHNLNRVKYLVEKGAIITSDVIKSANALAELNKDNTIIEYLRLKK